MMFIFKNLIGNEYFPTELPPCFTTKFAANNYEEILKWTTGYKMNYSIPLTYSGFKNENSRRKFAVPNIYHYFKAVDCIVKYSDKIFKVFEMSKISLSKPIEGSPLINQPYNKKTYSISQTKQIVEKLYQNNLYEVRLDISSFFDSIYTHSIPWAMHSKNTAKKSKGTDLLGNKLDKSVSAMNYKQTNGILVGNAVSRIISEIILCTIDKELQAQFKDIKCCRYVDDYYIFIKDSTQIQSIISFIRTELSKYELMLNENKIQINESPFLYEKPWVEEIKLFIHLNCEVFLNKVISLYTRYKDISILRYGLTAVSLHNLKKREWETMESKILNLWVKFPSMSDLIIKILLDKVKFIKKSNLKNAMYSIFDRCIPLNYHQEVIWTVWFAKVFNISIKSEYIIKIMESKNPLAIIILLDMIQSGICKKTKGVIAIISDLRDSLEIGHSDESEDDIRDKHRHILWGQNWLLAYEADLNMWLNVENKKFEYARKDPFFKNLIKNKISFYDVDFKYSKIGKDDNSIEYVTRIEFLSYIKKIKKLLGQITESINDRELIFEIEQLSNEIINKVELQFDSY